MATLKGVLTRRGFEEGLHYSILDNKKVLGRRRMPGRKTMEATTVGVNLGSHAFIALTAYLVNRANPNIPPYLVLPLFLPAAFFSKIAAFTSEGYWRKIEKKELRSATTVLRQYAAKADLKSPVTHFAFTRYGEKTFLLTREAAEELMREKPKKSLQEL